jgi:hypothetical protein
MNPTTTNVVVKWIGENAKEIRSTAIGLGLMNLIVLALSVMCGEFVSLLSILPRILVSEVLFFVPIVYAVKNCK